MVNPNSIKCFVRKLDVKKTSNKEKLRIIFYDNVLLYVYSCLYYFENMHKKLAKCILIISKIKHLNKNRDIINSLILKNNLNFCS